MPVNGKKWDRRIARARELAETYSFAKQILLFYSQLTAFQKALLYSSHSPPPALRGSAQGELGHCRRRWMTLIWAISSPAGDLFSR